MTGDRIDNASLRLAAGEAAHALRALADDGSRRLLCTFVELGEADRAALIDETGLTPRLVAHELAKLRCAGLIATRCVDGRIWRRIGDERLEQVVASLHRLCCRPSAGPAD